MRIDFKSMTLSAFKSFDLNQSVELPASQVTAVIGKDIDEGGSNGSAKSTFSISPLVNLFGAKYSDTSIKNLHNRYLNESAKLTGTYGLDGKPLVVTRVLGGGLSFTYDGKPNRDGKAEDVQEQLNHILKISPEQLAVLSNKPQGEFGGFLLMKDSAKKDFLSSFFDVSAIELAREKVEAELASQNKSLATLAGKIQMSTTILERKKTEMDEAIKRIKEVETPEYNMEIASLKVQKTTLEEHCTAVEGVLSQSDSEFNLYAMSLDEVKAVEIEVANDLKAIQEEKHQKQAQIAELQTKIDDLKQQIGAPQSVPSELTQQFTEINLVIKSQEDRQKQTTALLSTRQLMCTNKDRIITFITELDTATCPSCGSPLSQDKIQNKKNNAEAELTELNAGILDLTKKIEAKHVTAEDITQAQNFKETILGNIAKWKVETDQSFLLKEQKSHEATLASLKQTITILDSKVPLQLKRIDRAILDVKNTISSTLSSLKLNLATLKSSISSKEDAVNSLKLTASRLSFECSAASKDLNDFLRTESELKKEIEVNTHISKITSKSGFIGYIFDSLLEDLNSMVNENLKMIPNVRKFSLQFSSDKITQSTGAVNKSITYEIFSGNEVVSWDTLSGGEKLSTILAVDEALDDVLSRRLGIKVGWKFLDEQFYWIDENSKEAILNFYRTKSADRAYFIVDHASEFNASFDNRIVIVKSNNLSRFAV